ncbi:MAG: signal recognition particle-docking protein FtsY [Prochlorococcus sp. SP3034]|nr:signal recognition particle-docking protein FtsY [Prochlorococcus sp. SP3034]|tara:strand:- start:19209 stop:20438 length:1230 start_codon:yes stop_codon:yes gene_type:complete
MTNNADNSLDWAQQAYAQLKQKQELEKKELEKKELEKKELEKKELEKKELEKKELENSLNDKNVVNDIKPNLGEFNKEFTWSAMILQAQGKDPNSISIDEIDWLSRLRKGLEETRKGFVTDLLDKLGDDPLTPETLEELETLLLRADAGIDATDRVINALRKKLNEEVVGGEEGIKFLKQELRTILEKPIKKSGKSILAPEKGKLNIWLIVGVNGVGKTTTLGKLAHLSVRSKFKTLIAAADTFRAAAVEQLNIWGERSEVDVISNQSKNADPAAVVFDAISSAKKRETELLLVDTAGRLQNKNNLMDELRKIRKIIDKKVPNANVESLLVLDASQGQNGLKQARGFAKSAELTGAIITKLDGTSRGGVSLAVSLEVDLPIRFIGAGEGLRDLRPFNSFEFIEALLADR